MNTIEGIEGETNIQNHGDEDTTVLTAETDISVEKIEQVTEVLNKENESLIDIDKMKGLIKDEVDLLKFKAYELTKGIKDITLSKAGKIASTTALGFVLASCASPKIVMAVPQEMTERAEQRQTQTQEAFIPTPTSEATLSPEEIREQRLNEIAEVVKANDYRFTVEELSNYLKEHGTGWEGGVEKWMEYYQQTRMPFQYYFVEDDKNNSGVLVYPSPYIDTSDMTIDDISSFPTPDVIDEEGLSRVTESIYSHLYVWEDGKRYGIYEKKPGEYTVIFYIMPEIAKNEEVREIEVPNIGGFYFKDVKGDVKHVDYDDAVNKNLTDEEIKFFTDDVLASLKAEEGYIMFTFNKEGNLDEKSYDVKPFYNLLHSTTSSDTVVQEIN